VVYFWSYEIKVLQHCGVSSSPFHDLLRNSSGVLQRRELKAESVGFGSEFAFLTFKVGTGNPNGVVLLLMASNDNGKPPRKSDQ
jgi:hypothetical protein